MTVRSDGLAFAPVALLSGIAIALIGLARMVQPVDEMQDPYDEREPASLPLRH